MCSILCYHDREKRTNYYCYYYVRVLYVYFMTVRNLISNLFRVRNADLTVGPAAPNWFSISFRSNAYDDERHIVRTPVGVCVQHRYYSLTFLCTRTNFYVRKLYQHVYCA